MVLPVRPNNPNNPIPNNPFYSPESNYLHGVSGPFIVGSGLCVNNATGVISSSGGGGGGVTALTAGSGIALSASTGNVTVCTNLVAGSNIALTPIGNQIAISATGAGTGTVTAVSAGPGLNATTNPITTSGSLSLDLTCVIPPSAFAIKGDLLIGTGPGAYTALNPGADGQILVACSGSGAAGLCWATISAPVLATPTTQGLIKGCTDITNAALGCNALVNNAGISNVAVGLGALCANTSGSQNVALGALAGKNLTTGNNNVILGPNLDIPNPAGNCQLALGFDSTNYWLTGDNNKHIQPGAGIRDCAGNLGTAGQVLCSTGSAIQWASPSSSAGVFSASLTATAIVAANQQLVPYWATAFSFNTSGFSIGTAFNGCVSSAITVPIGCSLRIDYSLAAAIATGSTACSIVELQTVIVNNGTGLDVANSRSYWRQGTSGVSTLGNQLNQSFYFTTTPGNCSFALQMLKTAPVFTSSCWITYGGYGNWNFTVLN